MPRRLIGLLPETSFLRKLSILASGTVLGQALVILSSPLLTRLFTPAEFGLFAVFAGLAGIVGGLAGLRYEFAIPVMEADADAAALTVVAALAVLLTTLVLASLIWAFGAWFADMVNTPALGPWLWLLPPAVLVWGLGSALTYWSVRRRTYKINAVNRTLQLGSQAGSQVGLGFLGTGGVGLIMGYTLGYVVRFGHFLHRLPAADRRLLTTQPRATIWRRARENWRYPAFGFPSAAFQSICQHAPAILLAALYGPMLAGFYALSQRIMGLPVRMLSEAGAKVFIGEIRDIEPAQLHRYFLRITFLFFSIGCLGALPLVFYAPQLFSFVFGQPWLQAGEITRLLIPLYLSKFLEQPVSIILYYFNKQHLHFISTAINFIALITSFGIGHLLTLDAQTTILIFSLTSGASFLITLMISWRLAHRVNTARPTELQPK